MSCRYICTCWCVCVCVCMCVCSDTCCTVYRLKKGCSSAKHLHAVRHAAYSRQKQSGDLVERVRCSGEPREHTATHGKHENQLSLAHLSTMTPSISSDSGQDLWEVCRCQADKLWTHVERKLSKETVLIWFSLVSLVHHHHECLKRNEINSQDITLLKACDSVELIHKEESPAWRSSCSTLVSGGLIMKAVVSLHCGLFFITRIKHPL